MKGMKQQKQMKRMKQAPGVSSPLFKANIHYLEKGISETAGSLTAWLNSGLWGPSHDLDLMSTTTPQIKQLNGKNCIELWDGTTRHSVATVAVPFPVSVICVFRFVDGDTSTARVAFSPGIGGEGVAFGVGADNLYYAICPGGVIDSNTITVDNGYHIVQLEIAAPGAVGRFWIDGVLGGEFSGGSSIQTGVTFGSSFTGSEPIGHGEICQYALWDRLLTDKERNRVHNELEKKWFNYLTTTEGNIVTTETGAPLIAE